MNAGVNLGDSLRLLMEQGPVEDDDGPELDPETAEQQRKRFAMMAVEAFFDSAWMMFSDNVLAGKLPGEYQLGHGHQESAADELIQACWKMPPRGHWYEEGSMGVWTEGQPYHEVWLAFLTKCSANGLMPEWVLQHDDHNVWHLLTVRPAARLEILELQALHGPKLVA